MAKQDSPLTEEALIKEVCRLIRVARSYWDAHNNAACRGDVRSRISSLQHLKQKTERADSASIAGVAALP